MKILLGLAKSKALPKTSGADDNIPEIEEIFNRITSEIRSPVDMESKIVKNAMIKLTKLQVMLYHKTRTSLATYRFLEFKTGEPFDERTMSIPGISENYEAEEIARMIQAAPGRSIVVGLCVLPALCKCGNEQGYDIDTSLSVVHRAVVLPLYDDDEYVKNWCGH